MALPANITRIATRSGFFVRKFSPEILTTTGVLGTVAAGILASRATLKLEAILDVHRDAIDATKAALEAEQLTQKEYQKEMTANYVSFVKQLTKLYGPSVTLGLVSITAIVTANGIMKKRNLALAATLKGVEASYNEYRQRVIDAIGADKEEEIRYGVVKETITDEDGKQKTIKKATVDPEKLSIYSYVYNSDSIQWEPNATYNMSSLLMKQSYWNDRLRAKGKVFLNEVLDSLGIEIRPAGQEVGWIYDERNKGEGDNFIDFGIKEDRKFQTGQAPDIWLEFNCDGYILDKF